ncbi:MAG: hypothetical protein H0X02_00535 [Nitrosomonas sp.]|nr:hypothetical protein [Nitrosomonas sp.]
MKHYTSSKNHTFITGLDEVGITDLGALGGDYYNNCNFINYLLEVAKISNANGDNSSHPFLAC